MKDGCGLDVIEDRIPLYDTNDIMKIKEEYLDLVHGEFCLGMGLTFSLVANLWVFYALHEHDEYHSNTQVVDWLRCMQTFFGSGGVWGHNLFL